MKSKMVRLAMQSPDQSSVHLNHHNSHHGNGNGVCGTNLNENMQSQQQLQQQQQQQQQQQSSHQQQQPPQHHPLHQIHNENGHGIFMTPYQGDYFSHEQYFIPHEMGHHPSICTFTSEYGPVTVPMVSQSGTPPMAMPVQVPPGHVMQQIVDENGTLRHVILSTAQHQQLQGSVGVQSVQPHLHTHYMNGTAPHFFPLPPGFPPAGGPHYHPVPGGHIPHQQMPHSQCHSPSPPNNSYHKDERTQRQHTKLLKKLDQKQRENNNSALSTPAHSPSPRKSGVVEMNGIRKTPRNGASSVGTSEDGEESSSVPDEEEDMQMLLEQQLSDVLSPQISEITSRSALVQWTPPQINCDTSLNVKDLSYDVVLSDRGKEGKYKSIFNGASLSCRIQDLKPAQEYYVCLRAYLDQIKGQYSEAAVFVTPPCEPDTPQIPKLIARSKNSLLMRWNAPADNGGHGVQYILEYDEGKGSEFVEIIKTKARQYSLSRLQPSTLYNFRLAAVNEYGKSGYSDEFSYSTSGNPPTQPLPPTLENVSSSTIKLCWKKRASNEEFLLQMNDCETGHGYLPIYTGRDVFYDCTGLRRATIFYFRLRADNENGTSPWSDEVAFKTLPERPGRPLKPQVKGKIHASNFKVKWDPPSDRGGAEIQKYHLEISSGSNYEKIYSGAESETNCDRLSPGTTYQVRVMCEGPGGASTFSEPLTVTTEAVVPGQPAPPYCSKHPAPYAAVLHWQIPEYNGGAPVIEYEVEVDGGIPKIKRLVYKGKDTICVVKELLPGEYYKAQLRALNRIGAGVWSDEYVFRAGAAPPNIPDGLNIQIRTPSHVTMSWNEPHNNGADILEYRVESSVTDSSDSYNIIYQGTQTTVEIRNLVPYTTYYFRACATNSAGTSLFSEVVCVKTPAASPNAPTIESYKISSNDILLVWNEPENNGSEILHYNIEYADKTVTTEQNINEFLIKNLNPETLYKIKIQAVNDIGPGGYSMPIKLTTLPLPPKAPKLECYGIGSNFLKLKWGEKNLKNIDFKRYYLEMYNNRCKEFQRIYSGTCFTFKANKLQEMTPYTFRICAETDYAGMGDFSDEYIFKTCPTQPANIKAPRLVENNIVSASNTNLCTIGDNNSTCITIEWQHSKNNFTDTIEYILHLSKTKKDEFKEIYRGTETRHTIDNLTPGVEYQIKVCPIRILSNEEPLIGSFSPILRHTVIPESTEFIDEPTNKFQQSGTSAASGKYSLGNSSNLTNSSDLVKVGIGKNIFGKLSSIYTSRDKWTEEGKAIFYTVLFVIITIIVAAIVNNFIR